MSFNAFYNGIFTVYRVFGLLPSKIHFQSTKVDPPTKNPKELRRNCLLFGEIIWLICVLFFELDILIYSSMLYYRKFTNSRRFNAFTVFRLMMVFTIRLCIVVITVESYRHRSVHVKIFQNLHELDRIFVQKLKLQIDHRRLERSIVVDFLKWITLYTVILAIFLSVHLIADAVTMEDVIRVLL